MDTHFDCVVIGSGPGGYTAALDIARKGKKVCVIELDLSKVGGVCLNEGCIPTKGLIESIKLVESVEFSGKFGIALKHDAVDLKEVIAGAFESVEKLRQGILFLFKKHDVRLLIGRAEFISKDRISVNTASDRFELSADHFIIASGSRPRALKGIEVDHENILFSQDVFSLKAVPKSLLIIGAGAIGIEFASIFQALGTKVTIVELMGEVLSGFDKDISFEILKYLKRKKVIVRTTASLEKAEVSGGFVRCAIKSQGKVSEEVFEKVILSVGRIANTKGLGLDKAQVITNRDFIEVDADMRTNNEKIYAIGDCINSPMLAHVAQAEGLVASASICREQARPLNYNAIASVVYSPFEAATVGLTEQAAQKAGLSFKIGKASLRACAKAVLSRKDEGMVKVIADKQTARILGAHIAGVNAGELIHELALAIKNDLTVHDVISTVHAHPALSEIVVLACEVVLPL